MQSTLVELQEKILHSIITSVDIVNIWLKFSKIWLTIWPILPKNLTKILRFVTKIWPKYICVLYKLYDLFASMNPSCIFKNLLKHSIKLKLKVGTSHPEPKSNCTERQTLINRPDEFFYFVPPYGTWRLVNISWSYVQQFPRSLGGVVSHPPPPPPRYQ